MAFAFGSAADAIPALRVKQIITLADGRQVAAELRGDENMHWFETEDGECYVRDAKGVFVAADMQAMEQTAAKRRALAAAHRAQRLSRVRNKQVRSGEMRASIGGDHVTYTGKKKGLVILVEFPDQPFKEGHDNAYYQRVCNEPGFSMKEDGREYIGSVRDYFYAQSNGQFELTFDVVGPVVAKNKMAYYGGNGSYGNGGDLNVAYLIKEACDYAADYVNFSDYDWDEDGEADQVFVLYSGYSEAAGGAPETIWPHEFYLRANNNVGKQIYSTGAVDTYGCANELGREYDYNAGGFIDESYPAGIGPFCHEFSHCLGFADMYDTNGQKNYGMSFWDVMDQGAYLGDGFTPCNYTAFERIYAGWVEPIVLDKAATVKDMQPASDYGRPFIMYNDNNNDEYYLFENRKKADWDCNLYGEGLIVTHVDYSPSVWASNSVNYSGYGHQHCTIFHADNSDKATSISEIKNDPYPYKKNGKVVNNELTNESTPAATLYNLNTNGRKLMNKPVTEITRNSTNGNISFLVMDGDDNNIINNATPSTAISTVTDNLRSADNRIYSIDGTYRGTDFSKLGKGIYIVGGRKVVR